MISAKAKTYQNIPNQSPYFTDSPGARFLRIIPTRIKAPTSEHVNFCIDIGATPVLHLSIRGDEYMPTTKQRINITLEDELFLVLKNLADKAKQSLSSISIEMIKKSLEREEDMYFSEVADHRLNKKQKRITHSKAWK